MSVSRPELRPAAPNMPSLGARAGEALVAAQGVAALRIALDGADADSGWTAFWRGYVLQFDDLGAAREQWLRAEALFERDGDPQGLTLSACALVQCALLDSRSYAGFDARADRVADLPREDAGTNPLALFRGAARILLAVERRDPPETVGDDIERAFSALGLDMDPAVALRAATAALPMLGLGLDRVRSEDFFVAGARVAASPLVSDYARALWKVCVVETRFFDASWSNRLRGELDAVNRLAPSLPLRPLHVRAHLLRAALALGEGDAVAGRESLDEAHAQLSPAHPRDYWQYHFYCSRYELLAGHPERAWEHAQVCLRKQIEACVPDRGTTTIRMQEGYVLVALGRLDEAMAAFARAGDLSQGAQALPCFVHLHLIRGVQRWRDGALDESRAELATGLAQARSGGLTHFFRALPATAAEVCGAALELDAQADFAREVLCARRLSCPDVGLTRWPWPLRFRTLGGFAIEIDGQVVKFGRKAPRRMLELLRAVVALGGRQVDAARLAAWLWPDAPGDDAHDSLKAMLHRTRAVLGAGALAMHDGRVSFDECSTWIDTWAFEHVSGRIETLLSPRPGAGHVDDGEIELRHVQLLALYRGHFLGEPDLPAWSLPLRDRLRARFQRSVDLLGRRLELRGRHDDAIALYRTALEHDNLAEELYQRLIECHLARGEAAQAMSAYRRCREMLSIVLGLKPSARTESLVARIGR